MLVLTARRAAKAATLVRSRMDPRDTSTLRTCGCRPAGNHQDSPPDVPGKSRALPTGPPETKRVGSETGKFRLKLSAPGERQKSRRGRTASARGPANGSAGCA